MTDIEIASSVMPEHISIIAKKIGFSEEDIEQYGKYKAKVQPLDKEKKGKLVLVTAINPTPFGEGKTTTSIGLADGLAKLNKKVSLALREPSLGPVFGIKGGATGGGYAQVIPMEDINLHFTGDLHAITSANNLISSLIDNHIQQGNELNIDPRKIVWKRCLDLNDRALRNIICGLGGNLDGVPREDGFNITAGSEIMAVLCLSENLTDLKNRLKNIIIGFSYDKKAVRLEEIGAQEAVTILLKDALKPNLVQTLEKTPCFIHGGPFANIAHGCNSIIATKTALSCSDIVITEAGFGADLGAEKFIDIKCRLANIEPNCVVLVATVRSLKYNGGMNKDTLTESGLNYLQKGIVNLIAHIENLKNQFNANVVVAINKFSQDTKEELDYISDTCVQYGTDVALCEAWEKGGEGAIELAEKVLGNIEKPNKIKYLYELNDTAEEKIIKIATKIYGASRVEFSNKAKQVLAMLADLNADKYFVCIAKNQYSFSDNAKLLGRPQGHIFNVENIEVRAGSGFLVAIAGNIVLMPGLGKKPSALNMTIDENYIIKGMF